MLDYLKSNWDCITTDCPNIKNKYFIDLLEAYNSPKRHYHNLNHIYSLLKLTDKYFNKLQNPKTIQFAIWYHDAIYNVLKKNNEEKSAKLSQKQLHKLGIEKTEISDCYDLILATKSHILPKALDCFDTKFLIDIDLSILGSETEDYTKYVKQIRKEYSIYPDLLYNNGRKKVLEHFLNTECIYKTDLFFDNYEKKARENLAIELKKY